MKNIESRWLRSPHLTTVLRMALLLVGMLSMSEGLQAQRSVRIRVVNDTTIVQEVRLRDGSKLVGRVARIQGDEIQFQTLGGLEITLARRDISGVREITGQQVRGQFWQRDPSDSRLFFAPTARVPGNGRGYAGVYEVFLTSFGVGIGEAAMISGGVSVIPGLSIDEQLYYVAPKIQIFNTEYVQGAVGAFWVKPGTGDDGGGLVFTGITAGTVEAAFSGALAFPFASSTGFEDDPILILGGEIRASRGLKLISENWVSPGNGSVLSLGFRVIANRVTVEAAAATTSGGGFLPLVNFSLAW